MLSITQIEAFYSHFYAAKYNDRKYKIKPTKATRSVCSTFLATVDKKYSLHSAGETFLWDYFVYQWQYWEDLTFENKFSDKILIAWIIGSKAFDRWENRDREFDWQLEQSTFIEKYGVQQKALFVKHEQQQEVNGTYDASSPIRAKYLNKIEGFAMCIEFTTLFSPSDFSCIVCSSRADCKELLRVNYPRLYKNRIN